MNEFWIDNLVDQLAEITATSERGDHLILLEPASLLANVNGLRVITPRDLAAYLEVGEWGASLPCPVHPDCVLPSHVADPLGSHLDDDIAAKVEEAVDKVDDRDGVNDTATVTPLNEDEEDRLVRAASRPTLATLYKNARSKGLVPASPASGASGYF